MIVTFWPSSRKLAISPPQESATSSGCGDTNTWATPARIEDGTARRSGGGLRPRLPGAPPETAVIPAGRVGFRLGGRRPEGLSVVRQQRRAAHRLPGPE